MKATTVSEQLWTHVGERIAQLIGLSFSRERRADLERGLARAAVDFGLTSAAECAEWLLTETPSEKELRLLASHLTVGETYFFREKKTFDVLAQKILPEIVARRRKTGRRLRIWSAGCCTGEEPYSLAILLSQVIPDLADWRITILATDINERFLKIAREGVYGQWSFRDTPEGFKERYFESRPKDRVQVAQEYRRQVSFGPLNLVDDTYPSVTTDTHAMDIIFCRNVLMYFSAPQVRHVIGNLRRSLVEGGWLIVSPSEATHGLFSGFAAVNYPSVILFQRRDIKPGEPEASPKAPAGLFDFTAAPLSATPPPVSPEMASLKAPEPAPQPAPPKEYSSEAHCLANEGRLDEALAACDRWLIADKLHAGAHYLRAIVLQEFDRLPEARSSLQRAIYLDPRLVLAHFALGNLARAEQRPVEAKKHFTNALKLLHPLPAEEILPESDGLTAGRLSQIIAAVSGTESSS